MSPDYCVSCGLPVGDQPSFLIPKAKIHQRCQEIDGRHPDDIAEALPCCQSRAVLLNLCGSVVQTEKGIPNNQLWVYDKDRKMVNRFIVSPTGPTLLQHVSSPVKEKDMWDDN